MTNWISLSEATYQYGVEEEDVLLWIKVKEIAYVRVGTTYVVDDISIQNMLSQHQILPTHVYIDALEQLNQNQTIIAESYADIIERKDMLIQYLESKVSRMLKIQNLLEENNKHIMKVITECQDEKIDFTDNWLARVWKRLK